MVEGGKWSNSLTTADHFHIGRLSTDQLQIAGWHSHHRIPQKGKKKTEVFCIHQESRQIVMLAECVCMAHKNSGV